MNKDLAKAIAAGRKAKEKKQREEEKKAKDTRSEHEKYIASQLPQAQAWIKNNLYKQISEIEATGDSKIIYLGEASHIINGVSVEAIYEAAQKIKGLIPVRENFPIYEHGECVGSGVSFKIKWESSNSNDE